VPVPFDAAMGLLGQGVRVEWSALPAAVRSAVAGIAGGEVVGARTCVGGFSPGVAAALTLAGGGRAFVKAVSSAQNPDSPAMHRAEAAVNAWLPAHPAVPALLGTYDDGDWVALVFEHVDAGTPRLPWVRAELDVVLRTVVDVQRAGTPVAAAARPIGELYAADFSAWARLADNPPAGLDPWSAANAARLASIEAGWADAAAGDSLVHMDLRADNVLVRADRAWLVDWPWACAGAPWVDGVVMAASVSLQGGPPPWELVAAAYPDAPPSGVLSLVAGLAGFFTEHALAPAPAGIPTVRAHQEAQGRATREWLASLLAC
jgi:hypothetical protein